MPSHLPESVLLGSNLVATSSPLTMANGEHDSENFSFSELEGKDPAEQVHRRNNIVFQR